MHRLISRAWWNADPLWAASSNAASHLSDVSISECVDTRGQSGMTIRAVDVIRRARKMYGGSTAVSMSLAGFNDNSATGPDVTTA